MSLIEHGKVQGGQVVLDKPLELPEGTEVRVHIEPVVNQSTVPGGKTRITTLPFFGLWADREEMQDSAAWVRKERARWAERLTRQD